MCITVAEDVVGMQALLGDMGDPMEEPEEGERKVRDGFSAVSWNPWSRESSSLALSSELSFAFLIGVRLLKAAAVSDPMLPRSVIPVRSVYIAESCEIERLTSSSLCFSEPGLNTEAFDSAFGTVPGSGSSGLRGITVTTPP